MAANRDTVDSPVYAKVSTVSPTKPVVGRCETTGCMPADDGCCLYCGALFSEETKP